MCLVELLLTHQLVWYPVAFCRLGWLLGTKCSAAIPIRLSAQCGVYWGYCLQQFSLTKGPSRFKFPTFSVFEVFPSLRTGVRGQWRAYVWLGSNIFLASHFDIHSPWPRLLTSVASSYRRRRSRPQFVTFCRSRPQFSTVVVVAVCNSCCRCCRSRPRFPPPCPHLSELESGQNAVAWK